MKEPLPEVEVYSIGPGEAQRVAPLLTREAVTQISQGTAFGMALVEEGEVRAAVCARILPENETHLELVSLYVAPAYRRRSLGSTLFMEFVEEVMADTDGTIEYITAAYMAQTEGVKTFLEYVGFEVKEEEQLKSWQTTLAKVGQVPMMKRRVSIPKGYSLRTVANVEQLDLRRLVEVLRQNEVADLSMEQLRQSLENASYLLYNEKQEPIACAVVSLLDEKHVYLSQFFTANGNTTGGMIVLQAVADALLEQLPGGVVLEIPTISESSARLVQRLLPDCQAICVQRAVLDLTKQDR